MVLPLILRKLLWINNTSLATNPPVTPPAFLRRRLATANSSFPSQASYCAQIGTGLKWRTLVRTRGQDGLQNARFAPNLSRVSSIANVAWVNMIIALLLPFLLLLNQYMRAGCSGYADNVLADYSQTRLLPSDRIWGGGGRCFVPIIWGVTCSAAS